MLGIVVNDYTWAWIASGQGNYFHAVTIQRICLGMKLNQTLSTRKMKKTC